MGYQFFCKLEDLSQNKFVIRQVGSKSVGGILYKDQVRVFLNFCPHEGAEVCKGTVTGLQYSDNVGEFNLDQEKRVLSCPWHGWEYSLEDGKGVVKKTKRLMMMKTKVEDGNVLVYA